MPDRVEERRVRPRGRRRVVWGVLAVALLLWLGFVATSLWSASQHARTGLDATAGLGELASQDLSEIAGSVGGDTDDVREERLEDDLRAAALEFGEARRLIGSGVVRPLWYVPVLGRQLRSAFALSAAAATTTTSAADAVADLNDVLTSSTATGAARVDAVRQGEAVLATFSDRIAELDLGPEEALVPPLARARNRFAEEHARVSESLRESLETVAGVGDFLAGPSRYLLLASNNAEMRAGSGMFLQAGPLEVTDGTFLVEDLAPTGDLLLEDPVASLDPDVDALWGDLEPGREWRNTNLSPRFDESSRTAAAMWDAAGGGPVDGVVSIDVVAVERLLEVTGPVTLSTGEVISSEDVLQDLLVDQYADFADDRDARRERLGEVANAIFDALNDRPVSATDLVGVLRELGAGRHVLMWSSEPRQQAAWKALGTDGVPQEQSMLLSVLNRGGNKLDPYLNVSSDVSIRRAANLHHVTVDVTMLNEAPVDLPSYVAGPHPFTGLSEGEYKGIVALTLPSGAGNISIEGGVPAALGEDGPNWVAATEVRLQRDARTQVRFEFDLPTSWTTVDVLPSARVVPTAWSSGSSAWSDEAPHALALEPTD